MTAFGTPNLGSAIETMGLANSTRDYRVSKGVYEGMQRPPARAVARDQAFQPKLG